jgi:membrane-associated protease RseP (regulator of RpoE activity)
VVIFVVALLLSVGLHELGHFATAKKFGMKATRYFIGMGPTVWSVHRGETEYGIKALPIGGFVKIIGMTSEEEVDAEDEPRAFRRFPPWQRIVVLSAGSFMHFVLATVLLFGLALTLGVENDNSTQLGEIPSCVPASAQALKSSVACTAKDPKSPASIAGLRVGDTITSFNGVKVSTYTQLVAEIKKTGPGKTVAITATRDGKPVTLHATLAAVKGHPGGYLGIAGGTVFQRQSLLGAVKFTGTGWAQTVTGAVSGIAHVPSELPKLFDRSSANGTGVTSMVGAAEITGQVVAAPASWQSKAAFVMTMTASINIFVGVFNLFPLLPLDGGHILAVALEWIQAAYARRRGRPDPGLFDIQKLVPVSFSIFAVVIAFSLLVLVANVVNPVHIG